MLILVWAAALAFGPLSEAPEMADANGEIVWALTNKHGIVHWSSRVGSNGTLMVISSQSDLMGFNMV